MELRTPRARRALRVVGFVRAAARSSCASCTLRNRRAARGRDQVRICCLEVMGAAPAQLEHYRQEVRELQSLVADFRREVSELRDLKVNSSSDDGLTLDEHTHVEPSASHAPHDGASLLTHGLGAMPPSQSPNGAASSAILPGLATGGGVPYVPLRRLYVELDGAPIQSWYENRPMPPVTVKLMDDQSPPSVVAGVANIRLRVSLCNGRGMPEERTANGAQDLLVGEREAPIVDGFATFQNLRVMEISQKHYGSFQLSICAVGCPEGYAVQPLRTKQFVVQVGRMWSKRRKSEDEISPDDPISQIPGVGKQCARGARARARHGRGASRPARSLSCPRRARLPPAASRPRPCPLSRPAARP